MDVLPASSKTNVYGMSDFDYPSSETLGVSIFPRAYAQSFPQELEDQFKHMQSNFSTGLFPLISRAWMAIDSDLFLWNFETNSDLAFYEDISNTILLVDLVKPRDGFNRSDISFFLVIATTVDILLLPLSFRDEFGNSFSPEETNFKNAYAFLLGGALFKLTLEGLIVTNICCSGDGRIFFAADDSLYELEYYEKSWFIGSSCKKINHSKSLLNSLVPVFYIFSSRDEIRQLELDDTRHILYVLFKKGSIQIFDLGNDGQSIQKLTTLLREQIEHDSTALCNVTADYFKEIVSINAIPLTSDFNVNFVLTTSKGVRIYISCLDRDKIVEPRLQLTQEDIRPKTIRISQIRFPPTEQSFSLQGVNIYSSYISGDTCMMASGSNENTSFWIFTSSNFVCSNRFDEHNISFLINGSVWKIVKAKRDSSFGIKNGIDPMLLPNVDPPLIYVQHLYSSEKFFVLTSKGVYTYLHLAPVEIFRQILLKYGTESKQFQAFAATVPPFEICVMAIIVLCSNNSIDNSIRDVALRTFFVHGGEPQIRIAANNDGLRADDLEFRPKTALNGFNYGMNSPCTPFQSPRLSIISIAPLQTSTPHESQTPNNHLFMSTPYSPAYNEQSIVAGSPTVVFSPKHDALYAYFQRILTPLSNRQVCFTENEKFISTFDIEHVSSVTELLFTFKSVIEDSSLISSHSYISSTATHRQHISDSRDSASRDQERLSLSNLRNEIILTLEVLKLWIIFLEHNFNVLISTLPVNLQKNLLSWSFQDLVKNKENICTEIITRIVRFYMGDDASTKIISNRLRDSCPTIYTNDDALVVKATENLYRVKSTANAKEKKKLIEEAISTFLQSIQKLNLVQTCDLLIQIGHFQSIVDLALAKADKEDQSKLALIAYKKQLSGLSETVDVSEAIRKRNNAYNCITDTLELLNLVAQSKNSVSVSSVTLNASTFLFPSADYIKNLNPAIAKAERDDMLRRVFDSDDELANVAVFRWILTKNMTSFLLESRCRFFETFLFHEIEEGKGNKYLELLWKHYEKNQNHLAAAKILNDMATKPGSRSTLNQRITYLSHALVCIQSEPETKSNLELKIEIQDQLDVAQLQLRTKNLLEFQQRSSQFPCDQKKISDAISVLDNELLDLTILYEKYAIAYDLFEIKLDVLQCAGHYEQNVVEEIWKSILDRETESTARGKIGTVICKLKKHFLRSPKFVPIDFILRSLLLFGFKSSVSAEWLPGICNVSEISYANLLDIVSHEYRKNDPFWQKNPKASQYIIDLVIVVCEKLKSELERFSHNERRVLRNSCLDFLSNLLLDLHFKNSGAQQNKKLELLHAEIERIIP